MGLLPYVPEVVQSVKHKGTAYHMTGMPFDRSSVEPRRLEWVSATDTGGRKIQKGVQVQYRGLLLGE